MWFGLVLLGCWSILPDPASSQSSDNQWWCPEPNRNTRGQKDKKIIRNVKSWGDCALHCYKENKCKFWTWAHSGAGRWAFDCNLMSGYSGTNPDSNCISGRLDCQDTYKPALSDDCVESVKTYKGTTAVTGSGKTCQAWTAQSPHKHNRDDRGSFASYWSNLGQTAAQAKNYCRDPDNAGRLWCYTTDSGKRWEYCAVAECESGDVDCLFGHDSTTSKNPDDQREHTALHYAAKWNYLSCVSKLVADGAKVDAMDTRQQTPLSLASEKGHCDVMKKLVELGADVDSVSDPNYRTTMVNCGIEMDCFEKGIEYVPEADDYWNNDYIRNVIHYGEDCAKWCWSFNDVNRGTLKCAQWTFFKGSDVFENKCKIMEKTYKRVENPAATSGGVSCRGWIP